ncbi:hypothetical protein FQR65_LT20931 [Abscondita terminalis]|nr:hypothetical protein FQR65_LT20931 [Abscondita terminalis]
MGAGIGADEAVAPVVVSRVRLVVALQCLPVVLALVAEQRAEILDAAGALHQLLPEEMAGFVAQVADQCAIGLVQRQAPPGALGVIGFGHVQRDGAVGMAGEHGRLPRQAPGPACPACRTAAAWRLRFGSSAAHWPEPTGRAASASADRRRTGHAGHPQAGQSCTAPGPPVVHSCKVRRCALAVSRISVQCAGSVPVAASMAATRESSGIKARVAPQCTHCTLSKKTGCPQASQLKTRMAVTVRGMKAQEPLQRKKAGEAGLVDQASANSRANDDAVAHFAHVLGRAGDFGGACLFGVGLGKARQLHRTVERFHADRGGRDGLVFGHLGLHGGGDACVIDIGAHSLLVAGHGTGGGAEHGGAGNEGESDGAGVFLHGRSLFVTECGGYGCAGGSGQQDGAARLLDHVACGGFRRALQLAACTVRAVGAEVDSARRQVLGTGSEVVDERVQFALDGLDAFLGLFHRVGSGAARGLDGFLGSIGHILCDILGGVGGLVHCFFGLAHWIIAPEDGCWIGMSRGGGRSDDSHDDEDVEQDLGNTHSPCRDTPETEDGSDQSDDEKYDGVVQHGKLLLILDPKHQRRFGENPSTACMGSTLRAQLSGI